MKFLPIHLYIVLIFFALASCSSCKDPVEPKDEPPKTTPLNIDIGTLPIMNLPIDNPLTVEGVKLGRELFYDVRLSGDNTMSCATCHKQEDGFSDKRKFSIGIDGSIGTRQAMAIINLGREDKLFWDGRATSLEHQSLFPVKDPVEMKEEWENVEDKLQKDAYVVNLFWEAFGTKTVTKADITKAIAQFERTLISINSKFDKINFNQDPTTFYEFTESEQRGYEIFNSEVGDCFHCHIISNFTQSLFTDNEFHNNGLDLEFTDKGLGGLTGKEYEMGLFRTPTLRNIEVTAPYMHDGRFATLEEVVDHYSEGVKDNSPNIDPLMKQSEAGGIQLDSQQKSDLIAFLMTLTDTSFLSNESFSNPN